MKKQYTSVDEYISAIDQKWRDLFDIVYDVVVSNIPPGFEETISYNMPGFVVPYSIYPRGYHANPKEPLPFLNIAVQKNYISIYHGALYSDTSLLHWFIASHKKETAKNPNMGKSCMRYRKQSEFPVRTMQELIKKVSVTSYIELYENAISESRRH